MSESSALSISSEEEEMVEATPMAEPQNGIPEGYSDCFQEVEISESKAF